MTSMDQSYPDYVEAYPNGTDDSEHLWNLKSSVHIKRNVITLDAISYEKSLSPLGIFSAFSLFGLTIAVDMNPKMKAPRPNPQRVTPLANPLFFGNHSYPQTRGVK
jgi:hypothetical protein